MLAAAVRQSGLLPGLTAVTYVPMPPERERHRGYNQSRLLAEQLAKELGLPLREGVLARDGRATAHAAEGRAARIALAQESYRAGRYHHHRGDDRKMCGAIEGAGRWDGDGRRSTAHPAPGGEKAGGKIVNFLRNMPPRL